MFSVLFIKAILAEISGHNWRHLVPKIESSFYYLVELAESKLSKEEVDRILTKPGKSGTFRPSDSFHDITVLTIKCHP